MPNEKWVSDITYVWTREGWLYLAVVLDLFSRKVVGWSMGQSLERGLVIRALQMAVQLQPPQSGLLHHSDRGSQYCSYDYQDLLEKYNITCSMSRKGNCYDNAVMESFFATLKQELVYHRQYISHKEAKQDIFLYIHSWYNPKRRHSSIEYLSPEQFEKKWRYTMVARVKLSVHQIGANPDIEKLLFDIKQGSFQEGNLPFLLRDKSNCKIELVNSTYRVLFNDGHKEYLTPDAAGHKLIVKGEWWYKGVYSFE